MAVIQRSMVINAPAEQVFQILDTPQRSKEWAANLTRVADVVQTPKRIRDTARYTYSSLGIRFPMKLTVVEYVKGKKITLAMEGGMTGTMAFSVEPQGNPTRVTWNIDYSMKGGIIGKAVDRVLVERMNEKNAERSLENLRLLCEVKGKK